MTKPLEDNEALDQAFAEDQERLAELQKDIQRAQQEAKPVPRKLDHPEGGGTF